MKVLVSGGGTGGHIYPALALIREIKKHNDQAEFLYIGTEKGLENDIVRKADIPFKSIEITGFKRKLSFENVKTVMRFFKGVSDSKKYIKEFKPDVVIGTGGYVCGPVVYAAAKLGIPTIVHEQNSVPGVTNKFLSRYVDKVAICFEQAATFFPTEKVVLTGNPRASEVLHHDGIKGKESVGLHPTKKAVLVVGGSRGARAINEAVLEILGEIGNKDYELLYVTGEVHYDSVMEEVKKSGNPSNVVIKPFVYNMPEVLAGMDLVVARAGATTLAELTALGKASILIPSPYVTNNHQEKNASSLKENGAALVRKEQELTGASLLQDMDNILLQDDVLEKMKQASEELGIQDAAMRLYKEMQALTGK
ncbi:undecaprenyldiphospho-muramoylpentapeptide beta-N-acetylglucosaminyltransferase [Priestia taiwanensis]|uniref:UDP-N-acetylglucosamine--N-acetylmuramyl-(pentapeptide) pyrophosphoryl-undecaprenol N-acetylglucosamine transferase n=1 Tax=Priestia taiwanensis TaxID=1347902 RepID=A0A917AQH9_9BACI|nr:undecaprenyldiphospho-muramoylpentapeptide beta-N-acetylglucosaminyltransferase [Priestia taiwanensis]MBM7362934.1 UDP-N-acetylglucosamine--N-acetylmuramyl-(pentapeptide) pyrophosphoryl-undecaprenol N-acetylglucosamine transferase [Priestia taiwanensis]GGE66280.1 UDP-N-acetylglucosamine--N-acetylmuramyl-(pentapeptide) pyrophosphoryl-undecaprenol N-acetylglucosamine transferase 1 [Priestia taiwanensis]